MNETIYEGGIMKKLIILLNVFLLTSSLLLLSGCVEPIMSCAGIKTSYPRCAKFCTHDAVATCESSVQATIRSSMQPVMSCAGIKTYPRCAKFCTHNAVATCEASVQANIRYQQK